MPQVLSDGRVLLSTTEAVQLSGLSREHIQRLLRNETVEGIKPAHDWMVYEDSLKAFLARPRKPGPKGPRKSVSNHNSDVAPTTSQDENNHREAEKP